MQSWNMGSCTQIARGLQRWEGSGYLCVIRTGTLTERIPGLQVSTLELTGPRQGSEQPLQGRRRVPCSESGATASALLPASPVPQSADEGSDPRREAPPGSDPREYCMSDRDIVEVVRTEYVYTRPPPWSDTLPTIHVVTPTYSRPVQKAELTRMANTLLHVPNLHWLVVEDAPRRTPLTARLLRDTGLNYTHLHVETPRNYKLRGDARDPRIPRGTMQRNLALRWLRETFPRNSSQPGVVYFADDDNTYSLELFEEVPRGPGCGAWRGFPRRGLWVWRLAQGRPGGGAGLGAGQAAESQGKDRTAGCSIPHN